MRFRKNEEVTEMSTKHVEVNTVLSEEDREQEAYRAKIRKSRKKKTGITLGIIAFLLLFAVVINLSPVRSSGGLFGGKVAVIDINGEIADQTETYNQEWMIERIEEFTNQNSNEALVLRINTPGGGVDQTEEVYHALADYKEKTGRPVYVYSTGQLCSGGYYIAAAADEIYVDRNCWVGSIGVIMNTMYDVTELLDKLGIKATVIASGPNKAMGSAVLPMTDEQREIFQSLIDDSYSRFVSAVSDGRGMETEVVRKLADGRIYTAEQSLSNGLIDGIATEEEFFNHILSAEGLDESDVKYYELPDSYKTDLSLFSAESEEKEEEAASSSASSEEAFYANLLREIEEQNEEGLTISYLAPIRK